MKGSLVALFLCLAISHIAIASPMYIGAPNGLSLRSAPEAGENIITKLNYGEAVTVDSLVNPVNIDGFKTYWAAISYNGMHGYVVRAYLLPVPPPLKTVDDLKKYAEQLSQPAGKPVINEYIDTVTDQNMRHEKHLYKNGAVYTVYNDYEYLSESLTLPGISIQEAFLIVLSMPLLKDYLPNDMKFPMADNRVKLPKGGYRQVKLHFDEALGGGYKTLSKAEFTEDEEMLGSVSLIRLNGQVVIIFEYGS